MRLWMIVAGLAALGAVLALGAFLLLPNWLARGKALDAPAPDFTDPAGWIVTPQTTPPAVWEDGWAIDFFVLPPVPATLQRHGVVATASDPAREAILTDTQPLITLLNAHGAVYMPALRMPSAAARTPDYTAARSDLSAALEHYLDTANNGRALVPVMLGPPNALHEHFTRQITATPDVFVERVPLTVRLSAASDAPLSIGRETLVLATQAGSAGGAALARLPNAPDSLTFANAEDAAAQFDAAIARALEYLNTSVARRAEPLGDFEVIEMTPIRRPGETAAPD